MRFNSDFLDEACKRMYGHTDWEYIATPNDVEGVAVLFHEEPTAGYLETLDGDVEGFGEEEEFYE